MARFNYSPSSPTVGQSVTFNASSSTCPGGPCTYEWSNDDGPNQPIPPQTPLGSGQSISLTFSTSGIQYVRLLVTNVLGQSATVEHNVTVAPEPPPPPTADRAKQHRGAKDQRHCRSRPNAERDHRQLGREHADQLQLPVAAGRHHEHRRRDQLEL